MKSFLAIISAIILSVSLGGDIPYLEIAKGFTNGDANLILHTSGDKIILDLLNNNNVYNKDKAKIHLQSFLDAHPNGEFSYVLRGMKSDEGVISIGKYIRKNEKFKINLFFKWQNTAYRMESLCIRRESD